MASQRWCINHSDRPATARCRQCGKTICDECTHRAGKETFCSTDCAETFQAFKAREASVPTKTGPGLLAKLVFLLIVLAIAAFVAWWLGWLKIGR